MSSSRTYFDISHESKNIVSENKAVSAVLRVRE
jgi:hypothetical protein